MKTITILLSIILVISFSFLSCAQDRYIRFEAQTVTLQDFEAEGYILAIGGGGEGTIGRLKGSQVVAIDIRKSELLEAPDGALKIIMDARDLQFLDHTFNTATAFFTMMYIKGNDHEKVFREVNRVLKPGGKFLIWDAIIHKSTDGKKDRVIVPLNIKLPKGDVETGYGVALPEEDHDLDYYISLAKKTGFKVISEKSENKVLFLELQKPN